MRCSVKWQFLIILYISCSSNNTEECKQFWNILTSIVSICCYYITSVLISSNRITLLIVCFLSFRCRYFPFSYGSVIFKDIDSGGVKYLQTVMVEIKCTTPSADRNKWKNYLTASATSRNYKNKWRLQTKLILIFKKIQMNLEFRKYIFLQEKHT